MKAVIKIILVFVVTSMFLFTSCRKEEMELIQTPPENTLQANALVTNLMKRTATKDGSKDNILDFANCFTIKLPVNVTANSVAITVNSEIDYDLVESVFDEEYDDTNDLTIAFPITIIESDFDEVTVNTMNELNSYALDCNGENVSDSDIECIDFMYPISASSFNTNNEFISTETFTTDNELFDFIETITTNDIVSMDFPISMRLSDDSEMEINSLTDLEATIENEQNICDEDDDYDYDDDDCDDCTPNELIGFLTGCPDWFVYKLKRNSINYDDAYEGYNFNFLTNGTLSVYWNNITVYGDYSITGTGNDMTLIIDVPTLPLCNEDWHLQEIEGDGTTTKLDLRVGNGDRLRYKNTCN